MSPRPIVSTPRPLSPSIVGPGELIVGSTLLACSLVLAHAPTALRGPVVLMFMCFVPGLALVRRFGVGSKAAEAALAFALSLALAGVWGGVLLYLGLWSPAAVLYVLAGITVAATLPWLTLASRVPDLRFRSVPAVARATATPYQRAPQLEPLLQTLEQLKPEIWLVDDLEASSRRRGRGNSGASSVAPRRGVAVSAVGRDGWLLLDRRGLAAPAGSRGAWRSQLALETLDWLRDLGCMPPVITAGLAHGSLRSFRNGLERRALDYVVRIDPGAALKELAVRAGWRLQPGVSAAQRRRMIASYFLAEHVELERVGWPVDGDLPGTPARYSRFAAVPLAAQPSKLEGYSHRLVCEWRSWHDEPARFWLTNLSEETPLSRLVLLARLQAPADGDRVDLVELDPKA